MLSEHLTAAARAFYELVLKDKEGQLYIDLTRVDRFKQLATLAFDKGGIDASQVLHECLGVIRLGGLFSEGEELIQQMMGILDATITEEHLRSWKEAVAQENSQKFEHIHAKINGLLGHSNAEEEVPKPAEEIPFRLPDIHKG